MTLVFGSTLVTVGTTYSLGDFDSIYVPRNNYVASTNSYAIFGTGSDQDARVVGDVFGQSVGIWLGDSIGDANNKVWVYSGGSVTSDNVAIRVDGQNSEVYNEGTISGFYGVTMVGNGSGESRIVNHGTISGYDHGIRHFIGSTEALVVQNFGTISGVGTGIDSFSSDIGAVCNETIMNRGTMVGFVQMGGGADVVDNRGGTIDGDVLLGADADTFDNRGGTVYGTVFGEAGADTFYCNAALAETFDGGTEVDAVDFRFGPAVVVALDSSFENEGGALGDTYISIERVLGSVYADVIRGGSAADQLLGQGGADSIDGAAGNDLLRGGQGVDTLTGGAGNDTFRFQTLNEIGDVITDFSNVAGNDDKFQIDASSFGGGLVAGALAANQFRSRADNVAQDADDRFVYRTTDRTLWFDDDGNGAHAAVMVADLQPGATVTAADIFII